MILLSFLVLALFAASTDASSKGRIRIVKTSADLSSPSLVRRQGSSQSPVDSKSSSFSLNTVHDLIYIADITVGGKDYPVQLDTGSSDVFIRDPSGPVPNTQTTSLSHNLTYAIGWASGPVAYAPMEFLNISIPNQAFVEATSADNPALTYGAAGIAGLGFTRLSQLDYALTQVKSDTGKSLLYNLFAANPTEPNFITFALHRSTQEDGDVEGSFTIGEIEEEYTAITGNNPISTWPIANPYRWNVLLDALIVNQTITPGKTKQVGAPSNKAVVLLDSGSSYTYAPTDMVDAIYTDVPGAYFDPAIQYWRVPCDAEINMAVQIGGQVFPVHPLDVVSRTGVNSTRCIGTFVPQDLDPKWDFDWLIGDNVLRSVYSMYDFGDFDEKGKMGDPYVKLLSIVDPDKASIEFHKQRGGTPRTGITFVGLDGAQVEPSFFISNDISKSLEMIGTWMPAILAVVGFNALMLLVACIVYLVQCVKKRRRRAQARLPRSRQSPLPMNPTNSYIAGVPPSPGSVHVYEPVSMALTEDTFVPPSPAFHSKVSHGERPKSAVI